MFNGAPSARAIKIKEIKMAIQLYLNFKLPFKLNKKKHAIADKKNDIQNH